MKLLISLPLVALTAWTALAQGNIPIVNPDFDDDELSCPVGCFYPAVTGWLVGPNTGVQKNNSGIFPGGLPSGGTNFAYVGNANSTGSLSQTVVAVVRANTTYTLRMSLGAQLNYHFTPYIAALKAGTVVLAYDSSLSPAPGTFLEEVIVYQSGPNPPQLGLPLTIFVKSFGTGQVDVDAVSLTAR